MWQIFIGKLTCALVYKRFDFFFLLEKLITETFVDRVFNGILTYHSLLFESPFENSSSSLLFFLYIYIINRSKKPL